VGKKRERFLFKSAGGEEKGGVKGGSNRFGRHQILADIPFMVVIVNDVQVAKNQGRQGKKDKEYRKGDLSKVRGFAGKEAALKVIRVEATR